MRKLAASSTAHVMALTAGGMVLALAVNIMLAARFGATGLTDAIFVALLLPRMVGNICRDATKFSLVTVLLHAEQQDGAGAMGRLASRVLNLFLIVGALLLAVGFVATPALVKLIGPGLSAEDHAAAVTLFRLLLPMLLFGLGSAVVEVLLNSRKHFAVSGLRNAIPPIVVIPLLAVTWNTAHPERWVAIGFSLASAAFFFLLLWRARTALSWQYHVSDLPDGRTWRMLRRDVGLPLTGFSIRQSSRIVERALASLTVTGGVAYYSFAYQLLASLQNLVGTSVALTGQPRLTAHDLAGDHARFRNLLLRRLAITTAIALPCAIAVMALHRPMVRILYARGSFDAEAVTQTGRVLLWLGPAILFYCLIPVLTSALYAQKRVGAVLANMVLAGVVNVVAAWWGQRVMGLTGIALGATIASAISVANLTLMLWLSPNNARHKTGHGGAP